MWEQLQQIVGSLWFQMVSLIFIATVHGFGAAWLAVRMLFRPYKAVKILGITIFPQGMIPRHRDRLAETIGNAVGNELVSQETITNALFGESKFLQRKVESLVDSYTEDILTREFPSLLDVLPAEARSTVLDSMSNLQLRLGGYITQSLQSEETAEAVNEFVERQAERLLSARVSEKLTDETFEQIVGFLENRVRGILQEVAIENRVRDFVSARIDDLANTNTPLGELFTPSFVTFLHERIMEQIQPVVHQLAEIATSARTREHIGTLIKSEVNDYYQQLPFYQKFFVSRDKLHREIDDLVNSTLPRKIEETLRGEAFAQEAVNFLHSTVDNVLQKPLPELLGNIAPDKLEQLKLQISGSLLKMVKSQQVQTSISSYLTDSLQTIRPHSYRAILERVHPETAPRLKKALSRSLLNVLQREETARTLNSILNAQIERLLVTPIGRLSEHVSPEVVNKIGDSLTERIITAAQERLPVVIQEFNIGGIVRDKVDAFPLEKLEDLVLSIAGQHLRKIELFGLIIGFFLGIAQALWLWATFRP